MKEIRVNKLQAIKDSNGIPTGMQLGCTITSESDGITEIIDKSVKVDGYTTTWKDVTSKALAKLVNASIVTQEESDNCMEQYT